MSLSELIDNKNKQGEVTSCEKVLGDLSRVYRVADFWDTNADLWELIVANMLMDYALIGNFNAEEFAAYRGGLLSTGQFMERCAEERKQLEVSENDGDSQ